MTLKDLRQMPESLPGDVARAFDGNGFHESCFKAYAVLQQVKRWAALGVAPEIILELVVDAYSEHHEWKK